MLFLHYPKCSTCRKAGAWLDANGHTYEHRNISEHRPTRAELALWHRQSGLPLKRFFNTSGLVYRALELSKTLPTLSEDEQLDLLASDGMLVKRPILVDGSRVFVGFHEADWAHTLNG